MLTSNVWRVGDADDGVETDVGGDCVAGVVDLRSYLWMQRIFCVI